MKDTTWEHPCMERFWFDFIDCLTESDITYLEELENQLSRNDLVKEILVREKDRVIEAEIFPDYEYAKKKRINDIQGQLQALIDEFNKDMPPYKRIHSLIVRETEFDKTTAKKIKRF